MDLMPGGSVVPSRRRLPSLEGLELGLGSLVGSADSPELIAGVNYDWETQRKLSSSE
jgi:hypothetical protein